MIEKTLFVVEGLMYPVFRLYEGVPGSYTPSWVELSSLIDIGFLVGFTALAWGGMAVFAWAVGAVFFP